MKWFGSWRAMMRKAMCELWFQHFLFCVKIFLSWHGHILAHLVTMHTKRSEKYRAGERRHACYASCQGVSETGCGEKR
jgi:hypothetical protein